MIDGLLNWFLKKFTADQLFVSSKSKPCAYFLDFLLKLDLGYTLNMSAKTILAYFSNEPLEKIIFLPKQLLNMLFQFNTIERVTIKYLFFKNYRNDRFDLDKI
ncbi:hypothetical protein BpHYR1_034717 [Brachionus plicatilis]|uniref:Uncharacterized protein n=1 Tax=Brachionus plicatilis TaxID=10195 RepID=A0A3M7PDK0_BRAPC|nr:hypothetical protein BpHYR1_034717 [Brachionus plicatilis]